MRSVQMLIQKMQLPQQSSAKKYAESGFCAKAAAGEFDQISVTGEVSVTAGAEDNEKNIAMTDETKLKPDAEDSEDDSRNIRNQWYLGTADHFMRHLILKKVP